MAKTKTEEQALEKLVSRKVAYDILETLSNERCNHVETIFITENGQYHFHAGNEHFKSEPIEDKKTGKTVYRKVKLPGLYIGSSKVVAEFTRAEVLDIADEIKKNYEDELTENYKEQKKKQLKRPSQAVDLIREALKQENNG